MKTFKSPDFWSGLFCWRIDVKHELLSSVYSINKDNVFQLMKP